MGKIVEQETKSLNQIGAGTVVTGDILCDGNIRIDGKLNGNLTTKAKLAVGPTGEIIGDIKAQNLYVEGKVSGKIEVSDLLTLKTSGYIQGDIKTAKLAVDAGARFTGTCNMGGNTVAPGSIHREEAK